MNIKALAEKFREHYDVHEGCIEHFYLDTKGLVSIGIGHCISHLSAAKKLKLYLQDSKDLEATEQQKEEEFYSVRKQPSGQIASKYKSATKLYMKEGDIKNLFLQDVQTKFNELIFHFDDFENFVEEAQIAILDMAFNLGTQKFVNVFEKMKEAIEKKDWVTAAKECHRKKIQEERNQKTEKLLTIAASKQSKNSNNSHAKKYFDDKFKENEQLLFYKYDDRCHQQDLLGLNKILDTSHVLFFDPIRGAKKNDKTAQPNNSKPKPVSSQENQDVILEEIENLNLEPIAKKGAYLLKKNHPEIKFTSGRRDHEHQAKAMCGNVLKFKCKWIEKIYFPKRQVYISLQKWINEHISEGKFSLTEKEINSGFNKVIHHLLTAAQTQMEKNAIKSFINSKTDTISIFARNVIKNPCWIEEVEQKKYEKKKEMWIKCQEIVDKNVENGKLKIALEELAAEIAKILKSYGDRGQSNHFYGLAFDMRPASEAVRKSISLLPGSPKFKDETAGGQNCWHVEFKK